MPRAFLLIRRNVIYRWNSFADGLRRCGFDVTDSTSHSPREGDVLVIWNRHRYDGLATRMERVGARVIVAENGWIGRAPSGGKMIALCLGHHNGAGEWTVGEEDRWAALGVELKPWRTDGEHILVLAQRGIGEPGVAMPRGWAEHCASRLGRITKRRIVIRRHPGIHEPPPEPDWTKVHAAVTWASGAGIRAIVAGIPVFYEMPKWIGAGAAVFGIGDTETPFLGDRLPMLRRLAWAQWSAEEIATGEPIARLLA